jgi:hypothetical protein
MITPFRDNVLEQSRQPKANNSRAVLALRHTPAALVLRSATAMGAGGAAGAAAGKQGQPREALWTARGELRLNRGLKQAAALEAALA